MTATPALEPRTAGTLEPGDGGSGDRHPDTIVVDRLTAFLNRDSEPSGADTVALLMQLITRTGRPLLTRPTIDLDVRVDEDAYGLCTAVVTAGRTTIRVYQPIGGAADLHIDIDTGGLGVAVTVDNGPLAHPTA